MAIKITVAVRTRAYSEKIEKIEEGYFRISVKEAPIDGRANEAVIRILAEYMNVAPSQIEFVRGYSSKLKVFNIS